MEINESELEALADIAVAFKDIARKRMHGHNPRAMFQVGTEYLPMIAYIIECYVAEKRGNA